MLRDTVAPARRDRRGSMTVRLSLYRRVPGGMRGGCGLTSPRNHLCLHASTFDKLRSGRRTSGLLLSSARAGAGGESPACFWKSDLCINARIHLSGSFCYAHEVAKAQQTFAAFQSVRHFGKLTAQRPSRGRWPRSLRGLPPVSLRFPSIAGADARTPLRK